MWSHQQKDGKVWTGLSSLIELNLSVKTRVNLVYFFSLMLSPMLSSWTCLCMQSRMFCHEVIKSRQILFLMSLPSVEKGRIIFFSVTTVSDWIMSFLDDHQRATLTVAVAGSQSEAETFPPVLLTQW